MAEGKERYADYKADKADGQVNWAQQGKDAIKDWKAPVSHLSLLQELFLSASHLLLATLHALASCSSIVNETVTTTLFFDCREGPILPQVPQAQRSSHLSKPRIS